MTNDEDMVHQWGRVLRIQPGHVMLLLDGQGHAYEVVVSHVDKKRASWTIRHQQTFNNQPTIAITLASAVIRAERFEWLLQKATEIGVSRIVPIMTERSRGESASVSGKHERWQRIIREAAEQSCRAILPELLAPVSLRALQSIADTPCLWLHEGGGTRPLREYLHSDHRAMWIVTGPEGGFSNDEVAWMSAQPGWYACGLGKHILRAETAPLVAATMALALHGEFDGA